MSYVPSEIRSNILSFLPPGEAAYGAQHMEVELDALLREAEEFDIDVIAILAEAVAQAREARRRLVLPQRLFDLLVREPQSVTVSATRPYKGSNLLLSAWDKSIDPKLRRAGFDARRREDGTPDRLFIQDAGDLFPELRRLYEERYGPVPPQRDYITFPAHPGYTRRPFFQ